MSQRQPFDPGRLLFAAHLILSEKSRFCSHPDTRNIIINKAWKQDSYGAAKQCEAPVSEKYLILDIII